MLLHRAKSGDSLPPDRGGGSLLSGMGICFLILFFFGSSLLQTNPVYGADTGRIVLTSVIEKEVLVKGKDGKEKLVRVDAATVKNVPGDELIVTVSYKNVGNGISKEVLIVNPIPKGTVYKARSAEGASSSIVFSADGGRTFETEEKVSLIDASGSLRKARPEEITHIKWTINEELKPSGKGSVSFRAIIKK